MNQPRGTVPAIKTLPVISRQFVADGAHVIKGLPLVNAKEVGSASLSFPQLGVLSPPLATTNLRVQSFRFGLPVIAGTNTPVKQPSHAVAPPNRAHQTPSQPVPSRQNTYVKPPSDIIKLSDRLQYVLQPSLETLLARGSLQFPKEPFSYQMQGIAYLYPRVAAVLADEMGLGKTMQAISALRMLLHAGEISSVLLVCPKPLVANWQREFAVWAPELPVAIVEGDPQRREWQWQLADVPVKIANYELLCRDSAFICDVGLHFDLVVLDEAQRIKNSSGLTSHAVRSLSRRRSWALTGTPVENSPDDLLGIFEFVAPGHLSANMKVKTLGRAAGDYVLRRTKDVVLKDLPPKLMRDCHVELTAEQRETYTLAEEEGLLRLTELGDEISIQHVFELILRLKQICNFDPATGASAKQERLAADLEEVAASGKKAIIFSQWVGTLERLKAQLGHLHPLEFHGQIPPRKREAVLEQFRTERRHHVLLITYGAGGVGLNLQFCGYVFLFDRWWNPAVEDQAINRAHRIGVTGPVTVTRFLARDTIEERIDQVLVEKRELFDTIFSHAAKPRNLGLTQQEIFGLFKLRSPSGTMKDSPNRSAA